jgi:hypothetical protein
MIRAAGRIPTKWRQKSAYNTGQGATESRKRGLSTEFYITIDIIL